jgi:two-component system, NarL family, sensor kinase
MADSVQNRLKERVKELSALHRTAGLLQDNDRSLDAVMSDVVALLPTAWQYPEITCGRIHCGDQTWASEGFRESEWCQQERFVLRDGTRGGIDVSYLELRTSADEGPFLVEERDLIRSLSEMLRASFQHRHDDALIHAANERLEREVADRTASLRRLASEVCLAEERERRQIAENLHDHLGQALAIMKMRLMRLRGDAVLGGHGDELGELVTLSNQAIRYTRDLTFELSPPVLYELGLGPAIEWLGEQISRKHGHKIKVRDRCKLNLPDEIKVMLWKSTRELLHNVVKHAGAKKITITLETRGDDLSLTITDDGVGFDLAEARRHAGENFGLFSIEERLHQLGGRMTVESAESRGTKVCLIASISGRAS